MSGAAMEKSVRTWLQAVWRITAFLSRGNYGREVEIEIAFLVGLLDKFDELRKIILSDRMTGLED
jgi:hypothetical protein